MALRPPAALHTAQHFSPLHRALIEFLHSLQPDDWDRPTVAGRWRVKDVAAHLLDGDLRKLSAHRDGHQLTLEQPPRDYAEVVALIQRLNSEGVAFGARMSPRVLADLLDVTGRWTCTFIEGLDPDGMALFPVAWAGEAVSTNRMDTAREYTERWHHQMQIRDALAERGNAARLLTPALFAPLLETSMRALPCAYRMVEAPVGTAVAVESHGSFTATWTLVRETDGWSLFDGITPEPTAHAQATPDVWWRLFFNALPRASAPSKFVRSGPEHLLEPLWQARAVMV